MLRLVIRVADYIANGGGTVTGAYRHVENSDELTGPGEFPCDGVADDGETGREGDLIHRAGTVEPAGVLTAGFGEQLIAFGLFPTGGPIGETAGDLRGDAGVNPEPRWGWGCRGFGGRPEARDIARSGREQPLSTAVMAHKDEPGDEPQHPASLFFHRSLSSLQWTLSSRGEIS